MTIKVLDPTSEVTRETVVSPARLQTLDGSSIGLLDISKPCLLYTSPSPRDLSTSRMPSSA